MSAARSRRANDKHNHLQRTPILVMGCSLLIACCIAFGGTNWTASAQPSEDQLPEQNAIVEPGYYQETIGSYEAISQSDDDERAENLRLAAEAINGYVIEPGATFSFNEVVGDTTAERGYKEAPVLYSSGLGSSDGGGICQVSTALYIAAVKADLEIVERHPHSVPSDYAPIGLDATIVYGSRDLRIKNNTDFPITIYAKAVGQTVSVNLLGKPRDDGITIDALRAWSIAMNRLPRMAASSSIMFRSPSASTIKTACVPRAICSQVISMRWIRIQQSRLPKVALTPINRIAPRYDRLSFLQSSPVAHRSFHAHFLTKPAAAGAQDEHISKASTCNIPFNAKPSICVN